MFYPQTSPLDIISFQFRGMLVSSRERAGPGAISMFALCCFHAGKGGKVQYIQEKWEREAQPLRTQQVQPGHPSQKITSVHSLVWTTEHSVHNLVIDHSTYNHRGGATQANWSAPCLMQERLKVSNHLLLED